MDESHIPRDGQAAYKTDRWSLVGKTITVYGRRRDLDDETTCDFGAKHRRYWHERLELTVTETWQEDGGYGQVGPSYRAVDDTGRAFVQHFHYDNGSGWTLDPRPEGGVLAYFDRPILTPAFAVDTGERINV